MSRNSYGFTMVEVMVVLLILGIVSSVAVPAINGTLDEMKIDGAAREVVSAIYYVQSLAIKEGVIYGMEFFPATDSFRCYDKPTGTTLYNPVDKKPYVVDFTGDGYLQGVDIVSASFVPGNIKSVTFNSLGEPDKFGSVVLGYRGYQKTINVSLPLGKVSVN